MTYTVTLRSGLTKLTPRSVYYAAEWYGCPALVHGTVDTYVVTLVTHEKLEALLADPNFEVLYSTQDSEPVVFGW